MRVILGVLLLTATGCAGAVYDFSSSQDGGETWHRIMRIQYDDLWPALERLRG